MVAAFFDKVNEKESRVLPIEVFKNYMIASHDYSENEKEMCRILDIQYLQDPDFWDGLVNKVNPEILMKLRNSIRFSLNQMPKVLELIRQDYVTEIKKYDSKTPNEFSDMEIMTVLIVEDNMHFSSPKRLANVLESVSLFYLLVTVL